VVSVREYKGNYRKGDRMTRKDYELLAKAIREAMWIEEGNTERQYGISRVVHILAFSLQSDNSRFQNERFLKACGL
jgi:hypothetical protein